MKRVQGSRSIICSKKELDMIYDISWFQGFIYELPLFSLNPKIIVNRGDIETDFVLVKPNNKKLTQTFFDRINKTWNKMYES